jgi:ketosteroid isomerase-like protein
MREQNIALIQTVFDAFGRGDIQTILNHLADDVDWRLETTATNIPFAGVRRGKQEVAGFFQLLGTTAEQHDLEISDYVADGDHVIALGRFSAVVKTTGKKLDGAVALAFKVEGGKITRFLDFVDSANASAAYSVSQPAA